MKNVQKASFLFIATILFAIAFVACDTAPPKNSRSAQILRGKSLFDKNCLACHGANAQGDGVVADTLMGKPADLTKIVARRKGREFPVMEIAKYIDGRQFIASHGSREMPVWGDIFAQEEGASESDLQGKMGDLVSYLMSIQE